MKTLVCAVWSLLYVLSTLRSFSGAFVWHLSRISRSGFCQGGSRTICRVGRWGRTFVIVAAAIAISLSCLMPGRQTTRAGLDWRATAGAFPALWFVRSFPPLLAYCCRYTFQYVVILYRSGIELFSPPMPGLRRWRSLYGSKHKSKHLSNCCAIEPRFVVASRIVLNVKTWHAD